MDDDTVHVGRVVRSGDQIQIYTEEGDVITVAFKDVARIEAGGRSNDATSRPGNTGDEGVSSDLASLRRSSASIDDLDRIISRYEQFIKRHPADTDAAADLELWQKRRDEGHIKFRGQWVAPGERDELISSIFERANFIRLAIKGNDLAAAETQLAELDQIDPDGPAAAYFRGVLADRAGKVVVAEEQFQLVRAAVPGHAPTLINLAALSANRGNPGRAISFLIEAMEASPVSEPVLNATAEALAMLDPGRRSKAEEKAFELFNRQDQQLAQQMQQQGKFRWGSGFIDQKQWETIQEQRDKVETEVNALSGQYQQIQNEQETIRRNVAANEETMRQLIIQSRVTDTEGNVRQLPLPPSYFTLQDQNRQYEQQLQQHNTSLQRINQQAQQLRQNLPQPTYNGQVEPVGEDGVPVVVPAKSSGQ